ncbi:GIY-YIG nuclease family protein [Maribacter sp. IgM3_T14_3]|uniref:GIY-YIG nuclease family protein n=1 Tax=Maribacter sp. IgM3_T14_3 TaxID=3415140 RepID=UPI003C6F3A28
MYHVYVLRSEVDGRLYKGMTNDLQKRIEQHNLGRNKSTKGFLPWVLMYSEEFETRLEARNKEKNFKSGVGREFLRNLLN